MRKYLFSFAAMLVLSCPFSAMAQDVVEAPAAETPAAEAPAAEAPAAPTNSNDPGDIIMNYFDKMDEIVAQNMDNPSVLLEKFSAYIKENEKSMRAASKAFDAKLSSMKSNDGEVYRETVQRKITPALNRLITHLIDFSSRYPVEAQQLDSMLKVDAKYTYQQ